MVGPAGENLIVTTRSAAAALPQTDVVAALDALWTPESFVLLQGNLDAALTTAALARAKALGHRTLLNPSPVQAGFVAALPFTDILIVNAQEARGLRPSAGARSGSRPWARPGHGWKRRTAISRSKHRGSTVVDTTGAGDVVAGVLAGRLALGEPGRAGAAAGGAAASLKVGRAGTGHALPTAAEIEALAG